MGETIHRNFQQSSAAEAAQSELLAAGFRPAAVKLNAHQVDPASVSPGSVFVDNVIDNLTPGGVAVAPAAGPASLLSVDTDDDEQQAQAAAIMARHGAMEA